MKRVIVVMASTICLIVIYLMTLPSGVKMTWSDPGGRYVHYFSHFSFMPIGYGNWMPILTAVLVISAAIMLFLQVIKPDMTGKWSRRTLDCLIVAVLFSLISFTVFNTATVLSGVITGLILLIALLQYFSIKQNPENNKP